MRALCVAIVCWCVLAATWVLAAPAPKAKTDPPGPITEEQLRATEDNLKQIALAWHNYHDTFGHFPTNESGKGKMPLLSWRVQILPFIEQQDLYKEFKLNEPWDSEHNKKLIDKMPKVFAPVRGKADAGMTFYQSFAGKNGLIRPGQKLNFAAITDGTSNTLMVAEAAKPVIWTKPDDLPFDGKEVPALGGMFDGKFHVAFCDGSVSRFRKGINEKTLRRLIDPQDGEIVDRDDAIDKDEEKK
jgi:prepilin-type processing-associated H-X9-DG protein